VTAPEAPPKNGACVGHPTEWWFPHRGRGFEASEFDYYEEKANKKSALEICKTCEVRVPCLEYALHHEPDGIWGGYDPRSRDFIRQSRGLTISRPVTGRRRLPKNFKLDVEY